MHFRLLRSCVRWIAAVAFIAGLTIAPAGARADSEMAMQLASLLAPGIGGYWFTSGSANSALGSPKFVGNTTFYVKWKNMRSYRITGGYQDVSVKDHWQPYSGGNKVTLTGAAFKITTMKHDRYQLLGFVNGGIFQGHINSEKMNFKADKIVPSIAFGAEKEVIRYVKL